MDEEDIMYEVQRSEELGRFLVAVRDIEAREIIIQEDPLVSGPTDRGPKDVPVCLGCCCIMNDQPRNRCTSCHWPVCNETCEKMRAHAFNECEVFQRNHVVYPPPYGWSTVNKCILILRCLLFKEEPGLASWTKLMSMSDNNEIRSNKPMCISADKKILENFKKFFPAEDFSKEEVIQISGIIDVNAHAFPLKTTKQTTSVCNVYSKTSLMAHSCSPNASWSPDKSLSSLTLTVRANVPIEKGQMICVAYDESQLHVCTLRRVIPNEVNGMFVCRCPRCLDPTELGTFIGALKCPSCEQGYLLPIDPVDSFSSWRCDNNKESSTTGGNTEGEEEGQCYFELDDESVMEMIEEAEMMCDYTKLDFASDSPSDPERLDLLKEFVTEYSGKILHPNHYILQEVNVRILKAEYGKGFNSLSDEDLIHFLERCESLLRLADVLTPGFCEYRAFLQFHFSQGLLSLEKRKTRKKHSAAQGSVKESVDEDANHVSTPPTLADDVICNDSRYGSTQDNLTRLMGMLKFLLTYFKEINSSHKLLKPIRDSIADTETKMKFLQLHTISE